MKKFVWLVVVAAVLAGGAWGAYRSYKEKKAKAELARLVPVKAEKGEFIVKAQSTATVEPENRVLITPLVSGRVEKIFVKEGDFVKKGQVLAWLSSNERASLLDTVKMKGADPEEMRRVDEAYKMVPVVAQIDGQVIKRAAEPGQSISPAKEIFILSDRLIIKTQVDEIDIGSVKEGQRAEFYLDAFPSEKYEGSVVSIAHDSTLKEGITVFDVKVLPRRFIASLRSGMKASVYIITSVKKNSLFLPRKAVVYKDGESYVKISSAGTPSDRKVATGASNEKYVEILSGIAAGDLVMMSTDTVKEEETSISVSAN